MCHDIGGRGGEGGVYGEDEGGENAVVSQVGGYYYSYGCCIYYWVLCHLAVADCTATDAQLFIEYIHIYI